MCACTHTHTHTHSLTWADVVQAIGGEILLEIRLSEMTGPLKVGVSWYLSEPEPTEPLLRGGDPQGGIDGHREERTRRLVGGGVLSCQVEEDSIRLLDNSED